MLQILICALLLLLLLPLRSLAHICDDCQPENSGTALRDIREAWVAAVSAAQMCDIWIKTRLTLIAALHSVTDSKTAGTWNLFLLTRVCFNLLHQLYFCGSKKSFCNKIKRRSKFIFSKSRLPETQKHRSQTVELLLWRLCNICCEATEVKLSSQAQIPKPINISWSLNWAHLCIQLNPRQSI